MEVILVGLTVAVHFDTMRKLNIMKFIYRYMLIGKTPINRQDLVAYPQSDLFGSAAIIELHNSP
ncbi:hypothetical protein D3C72_2494400 [compost metagenome]